VPQVAGFLRTTRSGVTRPRSYCSNTPRGMYAGIGFGANIGLEGALNGDVAGDSEPDCDPDEDGDSDDDGELCGAGVWIGEVSRGDPPAVNRWVACGSKDRSSGCDMVCMSMSGWVVKQGAWDEVWGSSGDNGARMWRIYSSQKKRYRCRPRRCFFSTPIGEITEGLPEFEKKRKKNFRFLAHIAGGIWTCSVIPTGAASDVRGGQLLFFFVIEHRRWSTWHHTQTIFGLIASRVGYNVAILALSLACSWRPHDGRGPETDRQAAHTIS
jgi:hypothetical protein